MSLSRDDLAPILHVLTALAVMLVSLLTMPTSRAWRIVFQPLGWLIFIFGAVGFGYSVYHLRMAVTGNVEPVTDTLVTTGPYLLVRHPLYLAMIVMLLGLVIGMRSIWGVLLTLIAFTPASVYRAILEEEYLANKFGTEWDSYAEITWFILPKVY
jgi:protein-S-isoprenylcysteine O-methyltransferase Ste14